MPGLGRARRRPGRADALSYGGPPACRTGLHADWTEFEEYMDSLLGTVIPGEVRRAPH
ncbi:MAG: hypothetical protein J2P32_10725 [Actinobacteria bacterium]|nr:hypothetical protein [Actinomycetota bacterium]